MNNKRKFSRLKTHHLLKYKLLDEESQEGILSFVRNISAGGVLFHSDKYIKPESVLELCISFPPSSDFIKVKARVLRVRELKIIGGFDVAVEFLDLKKDTKDFIDKKIGNTFWQTKEDNMKVLASIFLGLGALAAIIALSIKFNLIPAMLFTASVWLSIVNTLLFFSIAISLIKNKGSL